MDIKHVSKSYGDLAVVDDVSLSIERGKITSFIGPNGAGKSTVINMMARLLNRDKGEIVFIDRDIKNWNSKELAKKIAILTQSNNLTMKLTVEELVSFGRFPYSGNHLQAEDHAMIDKAITYMKLEEIKDRFIDELSGGQRQRAFIAMVIAQDTDYILLDEPTNNLDIYHATTLMKMLREICDDLGKTVILVIHEINYAAFYSDYICIFNHGAIAKYGTVEEVMQEDILSSIYGVDFKIQWIAGHPLAIYY